MKYFRLMDDLYRPKNRWFLASLNIVDNDKISVWEFLSPQRMNLPEEDQLSMSIRKAGKPLDFTFADFDVIVINEKVVPLLNEIECQLIPVSIEDRQEYFVMIVLNAIDCLDESRSRSEKFTVNDPIRPDKAGQYKSIDKLIVDPVRIPKTSIFRLGNFEHVVIVSEALKDKFQKFDITGIRFEDVT